MSAKKLFQYLINLQLSLSTLCAWAVEKMWFFTGFRFPLVLCIEDTENLIGMSLRKCKCVLTRCFQVQLNHVFKLKPLFSLCIHLLPLHLLLVFVVPLAKFPHLPSPYWSDVPAKFYHFIVWFLILPICFSSVSPRSLKPSAHFPAAFLCALAWYFISITTESLFLQKWFSLL